MLASLACRRLCALPVQFLGRSQDVVQRREYLLRPHARKNKNIFQDPDKVDNDLKVRVLLVLCVFLLDHSDHDQYYGVDII